MPTMVPFSSSNTQMLWFRPSVRLHTGSFLKSGTKERSVRGEKRKPHPFTLDRFQHLETATIPNGVDSVGCYFPHDIGLISARQNAAWSSLDPIAWKDMLTACADWDTLMPPVVSIGNFVRELPELIPSLALLPIRFARIHRLIASGYLMWEFGWKPFIKDVQLLIETNERMLKRVLFLMDVASRRKEGAEGVTVRASRYYGESTALGFTETVHSDHLQSLYAHVDGRERTYDMSHSFRYCVTGRLRVNVDPLELQKLYDAGLFLKGALGLLRPSAAFWNALPISFMYDWVAPIQAIFAKLDTNGDHRIIEVDRMTHSIQTNTLAIPSIYAPVGDSYSLDLLGRATITYRQYRRILGPPELPFDYGQNWSPSKLAILIALITARL